MYEHSCKLNKALLGVKTYGDPAAYFQKVMNPTPMI